MIARKKSSTAVPDVSESNARYQQWVSRAYAFAGGCLFLLAIAEVFSFATPLVRTLLMLGIGAAGTAAWVMQAKRQCAKCNKLYGYHFRIVNANVCHHCGTEYPKWRPGLEETDAESK